MIGIGSEIREESFIRTYTEPENNLNPKALEFSLGQRIGNGQNSRGHDQILNSLENNKREMLLNGSGDIHDLLKQEETHEKLKTIRKEVLYNLSIKPFRPEKS